MRHVRVSLTAVLVLLLGIWGTIAGPGWSPQPYQHRIIPETSDTSIGSTAHTTPPGTYEVEREVIDLDNGGHTLRASVWRPVGAPDLTPGMVFIHGTGTSSHANFADHARALASAGVTSIVGDKPLDNYSLTERDYEDLADTYAFYYDTLLADPHVNPRWVGVYGESEGAFVAPIVATIRPDVSFVILVSAPVLPIRQQGALAADTYLRQLGVPAQVLQAIPRLLGGALPGGFDYIDFDVTPYQQQITAPVLVLYGTGDYSMPVIQGAQQIMDDVATAGNTAVTLRYYKDANHGLKVIENGNPELVPEAMRDTARWILGMPRTATATPAIAGAQPEQNFTAEEPGVPRWYASGQAAVWILIVGTVLTALAGLAGAVGSISVRGRRLIDLKGTHWHLFGAALAVIAAWATFIWYVLSVADLALSYTLDALIVRGGWLGCQAMGILAAAMVVRLGYAWWQARPLGRVGHVTLIGSTVGLLTLLTALAYWNIFPSILTAL